jgi:opine dehydrogenase
MAQSAASDSEDSIVRDLTILGGGNTAFAAAANLSLRGFRVTLCEHPSFSWTLDPLRDSRTIELEGVAGQGKAEIHRLTTDFSEGLQNDLLLMIVPAYAHKPFAEACRPHLREGHILVLLPGTLGTLEVASILDLDQTGHSKITLAETDTAPYVCRKVAPDAAHIWGVVASLGVGVLPSSESSRVAELLSDVFTVDGLGPAAVDASATSRTAVSLYSNVLECGLSAMNPVVHPPGVLMNAGRVEYSKGDFFFYEEGVTPAVCQVINTLDGERRAIGRALGLDLTPVDRAFHEAGFGPKGDLWSTINGSRMLTQLRAPGAMDTRWLTEDVPYGIAAWGSLADQLSVSASLMHSLVTLYK